MARLSVEALDLRKKLDADALEAVRSGLKTFPAIKYYLAKNHGWKIRLRHVTASMARLRAAGHHGIPRNEPQDWPEEDIEALKAMWLDGNSSSHIEAAMGGVYTRSAICGKIRRLGLVRGPKPPRPKEVKPIPPLPQHDPTLLEEVGRLNELGLTPSEIGRKVKASRQSVGRMIAKIGQEPVKREPFIVHPMWSMPEDERRIAFYEKFMEGWKEVQERLNAR